MGRLKKAAVECNDIEVARQIKEQVIPRLNDSEMLAEIIREFTKSDDNLMIPSELVLIWAKIIEGLGAQEAVINRLHDVKNFDA